MSWQLVARKDFEDAVRSWMFWAIIAVALGLLVIVSFGVATGETDEIGQTLVYSLFNSLGAQILVPGMAMVFGYLAIAGERQSGSLRVLFGLSHGRRDVFVGKLLSRSGLLGVGVALSVGVVAGLVVLLFDGFDVGLFVGFAWLTLLLALSFVGLAVGISAATSTRAKAMGGAIATYVGLLIGWHPAAAMAHYLLEGELPGLSPPDWYLLALQLNPLTAYRHALGRLADDYMWPFIGWPNIVEDIPQDALASDTALLVGERAAGSPFYATDWFVAAVLLAWFAVPLALGYWRFRGADLN
jgi:ABC-2 type transport system permease protein